MERLRTLRKDKSRTQAQMAEFLGISQQAYATYENDKAQPPVDMLQKLADYFNVTVDYLLERTETPKEQSQLNIPEELQQYRVAFHGGLDGLTQNDIDDVAKFVEFLKSKNKLD